MTEKELHTYIERYQQLIRVLQGLTTHEKRWHLRMEDWSKNTDCGTTKCAAGFAGSDAWFIERGFTLQFAGPRYQYPDSRFGSWGWDAVLEFFGPVPPKITSNVHHSHPVFAVPRTYGQVIKAAKAHIRLLKELAREARGAV